MPSKLFSGRQRQMGWTTGDDREEAYSWHFERWGVEIELAYRLEAVWL